MGHMGKSKGFMFLPYELKQKRITTRRIYVKENNTDK
jgi:hypothetical protein